MHTNELDDRMRSDVIRLCVEAHREPDFENLFSYLPDDGLHVLATIDDRTLVGHAVVTTRWLQAGTKPMLRTAYVDAVATSPQHQGQGIGTTVMRHLATLAIGWEIACLETDGQSFYEQLGWEEWRGPLAGRTDTGLIPTPDQRGIMILRLPDTPPLDLQEPLTIEANQRIW
jgi:aminoglycoside 2'-N-acetyltransferase I